MPILQLQGNEEIQISQDEADQLKTDLLLPMKHRPDSIELSFGWLKLNSIKAILNKKTDNELVLENSERFKKKFDDYENYRKEKVLQPPEVKAIKDLERFKVIYKAVSDIEIPNEVADKFLERADNFFKKNPKWCFCSAKVFKDLLPPSVESATQMKNLVRSRVIDCLMVQVEANELQYCEKCYE